MASKENVAKKPMATTRSVYNAQLNKQTVKPEPFGELQQSSKSNACTRTQSLKEEKTTSASASTLATKYKNMDITG